MSNHAEQAPKPDASRWSGDMQPMTAPVEARCPECGHVLSTGEHSDDCMTARNPGRLRELRAPVESTPDGGAVETRARLTKMVADVIAMHPCGRDSDGHDATECPTAKAVIENLSRPSALRALVELAPDHPRNPVLPDDRPPVEAVETVYAKPYPTSQHEHDGTCGRDCDAGWICTRTRGHDGDHEAGLGDGERGPILIPSWPNERRPPVSSPVQVDGERPEIVVLCGSTRFYDEFQQANYDLTMQGKIVLSVGFYPHAKAQHGHGEGVGHDSAEKAALDELHKRKIDLADRVLVLNVGGYLGKSTRSEVRYAWSIAHKPVEFLWHEPDEHHDGFMHGLCPHGEPRGQCIGINSWEIK